METGKMKLALSAGVLAVSLALAGCGGGGSSGTAAGPEEPDPKLVAAQGATMTAATAADTAAMAADAEAKAADTAAMAADTAAKAADTAAMAAAAAAMAAETAATAQMANISADEANYALAQNAATRARAAAGAAAAAKAAADTAKADADTAKADADTAKAAADAAKAAADAANATARDATTAEAAEAAQATAEAEQAKAEAAQATAEAEQAKAEAAQATAEAEQAKAEAAQELAETEQANAESYAGMVAAAQQANDDEDQRVMDVASARSAAMASYMDADADAKKAEDEAAEAEAASPGSPGAMAARTAANDARAAANAAKAAHDAITDDMTKAQADAQAAMAATEAGKANAGYVTAKAENNVIKTAGRTQEIREIASAKIAANAAVMAAETAKNKADEAARAAGQARDDAEAAYNMAMAARTDVETAKAEYEKAKAAAMVANTAASAANTAYMQAKTAAEGIIDDGTADAARVAQATAETERGKAETERGKAETEQGNAVRAQMAAMKAADTHVLGLLVNANPGDDAETTDVNEQTRVANAVNTAAAANDNGEATTAVTLTWPADVAATDTAEAMPGMLSISVDPAGSGTGLAFRTEATDTAPKTATKIAGLGDFMHGYSISDDDRHVIVFTDKQQGTPAVTEVTGITARELVDDPVTGNTITDLGTRSGTGYTGVTLYELGSVTDNTDSDLAFTGTLTCPSSDAGCSAETAANGDITVTGFVFTGSRAARAAVAAAGAAENTEYLAFGVWMREDADNDGDADDPDFGAFAAGGSTAPAAVEITGTATYEGSATGVYTAGKSVDYFQGDATLTANFGAPGTTGDPDADDDEAGTITGMINKIVAGGRSMSDVIHLNDDLTPNDGNISADGTFSGNARMGTATTVDNVTTYTHNGDWSGRFYNGTTDDPATADVDESHVAPGSVAGHFGVTGTVGTGDDAITRSYVGAFGAHKK